MSDSFSAAANGVLHERPSIVVIDRRALSRSCLARILKNEFPDLSILEIETAQQLDTGSTRQVCLVTLDVGSCAMSDNGLLQTLACVHR